MPISNFNAKIKGTFPFEKRKKFDNNTPYRLA